MIRSEHMKSCLTTQIRFMLFKGPGPCKKNFKIGGNVDKLKTYRLILGMAVNLSGKEQRTHCSTCVAVANILYPHGDVAGRTCGSRLRKNRQTGSLI
jgi:hypothetical protein